MKKKLSKILALVLKSGIILVFLGLILFLSMLLYYSKNLPRPEKFTERRLAEPTEIYDKTGEHILYTLYGEEKREPVPLEEMSPHLKNAVVAAEDKKFYDHFGIDPWGIVRALLIDVQRGAPVQGASTIPQQLIRSTFLTPQKNIERKVREIILSIELDNRYSKNQILEWYLNQVPFGSNAYGVEAASKTFFSKKAKDLKLAEAATLASLIKAPSRLSPYGPHKEELLERKDYVIDEMVKEGYVSREEAEKAKKEEVVFGKKSSTPLMAPHFVLEVKSKLVERYGEEYLKTEGLKVYTTLNWELQQAAEKIVEEGAEKNEAYRSYNAALVAIDPKNGELAALVGNKNYFGEPHPQGCVSGKNCLFDPDFNVASFGKRQPGSSFKPLVYATAFEKGYSDKHVVVDEPTNFGVWGGKEYTPKNYDGFFRGPVTLRQSLAQSLNVPSVKVLVYLAGIEESVLQAKKMGITTLKEPSYYGPALVLGGGEVTLKDMVSAFSVFANNGKRHPSHSISRIEDKRGEVIYEFQSDAKRVLSDRSASLITSVLSDEEARAPMFGSNSVLYVDDETAVKTGTTQYYNDAWTIGYDKKIAAGVWTGNNDNSSTANKPGVVIAGPIWHDFMVEAKKIIE